jgi:hypothetical protein
MLLSSVRAASLSDASTRSKYNLERSSSSPRLAN